MLACPRLMAPRRYWLLMSLTLNDITVLFDRYGHIQYTGEPVTQLEHALQSATLAEQAGAASSLVTACLLHDLGHMLEDAVDTPTLHGVDDLHQYRILPFLRPLFDEDVLAPIRLHVDAKRYLCAVDQDYFSQLSQDSVRSLALQGGVFTPEQAAHFIALPFAADAVNLRRWDDLAKRPDYPTPSLAHFMDGVQRCARKSIGQ